MTTQILAPLPLTEEQRSAIRECGDVELIEVPPRPEPAMLEQLAEKAEVWLGFRIGPNILRNAPNLRWIQTISAGVDRLLFPELKESDITLTNVRGMHAETIADHVFALILAFARDLPHFLRRQQEKQWDRREVRSLAGTKLAVVGLGGIGAEVARRGAAFGMRVSGTVRHPRQIDGVERVFGPEGLMEVVAGADWVIVACPLTEETHHLIGREALEAMGPRSVLINIGRGKIVNEEALVHALREGVIQGAGLDVFEEEPLPPHSPLWEMTSVIVTPHIAGSMQSYMDRAVEIFCANLRRYLKGEPLQNVVDKKLGY